MPSYFCALRAYFLCHFYVINLIPSVIFHFSNEEDEQILRLRVVIKNNVKYVEALTWTECLTDLQRFCQQMVVFFCFFFPFFLESARRIFNLSDEIYLLGWGDFWCWNSVVTNLPEPTVASQSSPSYLLSWTLTGYSYQKSFSSGY